MISLASYLKRTDEKINTEEQKKWFKKLKTKTEEGVEIYKKSTDETKRNICLDIQNRIRTEEIKAWYSTPQENSLFQGTSI